MYCAGDDPHTFMCTYAHTALKQLFPVGFGALIALCINWLFLLFLVSSKSGRAQYHLSLQRGISYFWFQIASPSAAAVWCRAEVRFDPPLTDFPLWPVVQAYSDRAMATNASFLIRFSETTALVLYHQRDYEMGMTCKMFLCCSTSLLKVRG